MRYVVKNGGGELSQAGMTSSRVALNVKQVALQLNVSQNTVRRLIDDRKLACIRIGRAIRVTHEDLENFVARVRAGAEVER